MWKGKIEAFAISCRGISTKFSGETIIYERSLSDAKVALRMSAYWLGLNEGFKPVWRIRIVNYC